MSDQELEKTLWATADKLRGNIDAAEYKHVVLGLIFLKYLSDAFKALHDQLVAGQGEFEGADPEDPDEYAAYNVFFVPPKARWTYLQDRAKQPEIGKFVDDAMDAIERSNQGLKGVLPKNYARPDLDKSKLGQVIDLIGTIGFQQEGHKAKDLLGRVYEYFLGQFADAEGKKGGQFYTPPSIVKLLVEMLEPYEGRIYDGCCGSGGMFVQSEKFIEAREGLRHNNKRKNTISVFGQESNPTTLRLAKMNLAIRGIDAKLELGDTLLNDQHPDLKADHIIVNPPFNISDWSGEQLRDDFRWQYGVPPVGNANYAWLQHFVHKLSPLGTAGIVLANGSMTSNSGGEGDIRKNLVEAQLVDCMVALPSQLFYNTMIPACLWFLARKKDNPKRTTRLNEILFIDARNRGHMVSRRHRELSEEDIKEIADTYHRWKAEPPTRHAELGSASLQPEPPYEDQPGFSKSATLAEVAEAHYVLTPGRYVGTEALEEEGQPFEEKMKTLTQQLAQQIQESHSLEQKIKENLKRLGYEF